MPDGTHMLLKIIFIGVCVAAQHVRFIKCRLIRHFLTLLFGAVRHENVSGKNEQNATLLRILQVKIETRYVEFIKEQSR